MLHVKATVIGVIPLDKGYIVTVSFDHPTWPEAPTQQRSFHAVGGHEVGQCINLSMWGEPCKIQV